MNPQDVSSRLFALEETIAKQQKIIEELTQQLKTMRHEYGNHIHTYFRVTDVDTRYDPTSKPCEYFVADY